MCNRNRGRVYAIYEFCPEPLVSWLSSPYLTCCDLSPASFPSPLSVTVFWSCKSVIVRASCFLCHLSEVCGPQYLGTLRHYTRRKGIHCSVLVLVPVAVNQSSATRQSLPPETRNVTFNAVQVKAYWHRYLFITLWLTDVRTV